MHRIYDDSFSSKNFSFAIYATLFCLIALNNVNAQSYCTPEYLDSCSNLSNITLFQLTGDDGDVLHRESSPSESSTFSIYEADSTFQLSAGDSYSGSVSTFRKYAYFLFLRAWIDFNQDKKFSSDEEVIKLGRMGPENTRNFNIHIPSEVKTGRYRLRVRLVRFAEAGLSPCAAYAVGETEDYIIRILSQGTSTLDTEAGNAVQLYPNPSSSILMLHYSGQSKIKKIHLYDSLGRRIGSLEGHSESLYRIHTADFSPGIYYVKLILQDAAITQAFEVIR